MLQYLKVGDQELPISFGMNALRVFAAEQDLKLSDFSRLTEILTFDMAIRLIFVGVREGHRIAAKPFDYSIETFCDLLDKDADAMSRSFELISASMQGGEQPAAKKKAKK